MKEEKKRKGNFFKIFSLILILLVCIFLYARYIGTSGLKVKEYAIYSEHINSDYNGFKIAHFSDVHYGRTTDEKDLKHLVKEINDLNSDIIIFTGDLFDFSSISDKNKNIMIENLKNMTAKLFKFAVIGDYDKKYLDTYKEILNASGFILLDNELEEVYYKSKTPINFIGITDYQEEINDLYNDNLNITIMHEADTIKNISKTNIAFAGHSLGGQLVIPFIGGIVKQKGANTYIDSYYKVNNSELYVSNGIGTQKFSFRIFNKPSISLYRLYQS